MPNIKIKSGANEGQLRLCLSSIAAQIEEQNGVKLVWSLEQNSDGVRIHYTWQVPEAKVFQDAQKKIARMPGKMFAGTAGVQRLTNGDIKNAIKNDMKGRGCPIKFKGWM